MTKDRRFRTGLELAGLVSDDGRLHAYLQANHGVWVPPSVQVVEQGNTVFTSKQPCIIYPIPASLADQKLGTGIRSRVDLAWELPRFEEAGWRKREVDGDALLNGFLALADSLPLTSALLVGDIDAARKVGSPLIVGAALARALGISSESKDPQLREIASSLPSPDSIQGLLRQEWDKVSVFASRWGPLFLSPTYQGDNWTLLPPTYAKPPEPRVLDPEGRELESYMIDYPNERKGRWPACEPITAFYVHAKEVKTALDIGASLLREEPSPNAVWTGIGFSDSEFLDIHKRQELLEAQTRALTGLVCARITVPESVHLRLKWDTPGNPKLEFTTGFGFLSVLWVQVAQVLAGQRAMYTCAACGRPFIRSRRIPSGRRAYCPNCSENGKGSKRLWYRENRSPVGRSS